MTTVLTMIGVIGRTDCLGLYLLYIYSIFKYVIIYGLKCCNTFLKLNLTIKPNYTVLVKICLFLLDFSQKNA